MTSGLFIKGLQYELVFLYLVNEMRKISQMRVELNERSRSLELPAIGVWTTLQASHQINEAGKPIFSIVVGGVEVHKEEIPFKTGNADVKVYTSNPWVADTSTTPGSLPSQNGCIKDIIIEYKE